MTRRSKRDDFGGPVRVLMLGGGYVSIWAYRSMRRNLKRALSRGSVQITVVSPDNYHYFHGWSGEAIGGIIDHTHHHTPLRRIFEDASIIRGKAMGIDTERQRVAVELVGTDGRRRELDYDYLVLGHGAKDRTQAIPGLREHGHVLRRTGGLIGLRNRLFRVLERADAIDDPDERDRLLSFVVGGGGFAGVEMCAALAELLEIMSNYYPVLQDHRPDVRLVHAGHRLIPELRPDYDKLADYAAEQLRSYGVQVHRNTRLERVNDASVVLDDGTELPAGLVLSAVGTEPVVIDGTDTFERDDTGRMVTDEYLRVGGIGNVWTGGDAAHVPHVRSGQACPSNALWAIKHGDWIGRNVAHTINDQPMEQFTYGGLGQAASFGVGKGALELYGYQFTGWTAWLARLGFFLYFMPAWVQRIQVLADWISLPFLGRTMIPLESPEPTVEPDPSASQYTHAGTPLAR